MRRIILKVSCWLRRHPYVWQMDAIDEELWKSDNYIPNRTPPTHCPKCGSTNR